MPHGCWLTANSRVGGRSATDRCGSTAILCCCLCSDPDTGVSTEGAGDPYDPESFLTVGAALESGGVAVRTVDLMYAARVFRGVHAREPQLVCSWTAGVADYGETPAPAAAVPTRGQLALAAAGGEGFSYDVTIGATDGPCAVSLTDGLMRGLERAVFLAVSAVAMRVPPSTSATVLCACVGSVCQDDCASSFVYPAHDFSGAPPAADNDPDAAACAAMTFRLNVSTPDRAFASAAYKSLSAGGGAATAVGSAARSVALSLFADSHFQEAWPSTSSSGDAPGDMRWADLTAHVLLVDDGYWDNLPPTTPPSPPPSPPSTPPPPSPPSHPPSLPSPPAPPATIEWPINVKLPGPTVDARDVVIISGVLDGSDVSGGRSDARVALAANPASSPTFRRWYLAVVQGNTLKVAALELSLPTTSRVY